jgi:hypothetical protein
VSKIVGFTALDGWLITTPLTILTIAGCSWREQAVVPSNHRRSLDEALRRLPPQRQARDGALSFGHHLMGCGLRARQLLKSEEEATHLQGNTT